MHVFQFNILFLVVYWDYTLRGAGGRLKPSHSSVKRNENKINISKNNKTTTQLLFVVSGSENDGVHFSKSTQFANCTAPSTVSGKILPVMCRYGRKTEMDRN